MPPFAFSCADKSSDMPPWLHFPSKKFFFCLNQVRWNSTLNENKVTPVQWFRIRITITEFLICIVTTHQFFSHDIVGVTAIILDWAFEIVSRLAQKKYISKAMLNYFDSQVKPSVRLDEPRIFFETTTAPPQL
jgi:hypothetical protein